MARRPPPPPPRPQPDVVPFEDPALGFLERLVATVAASFTKPTALFSAVREGSLGPPVLYALVVGTIAQVAYGLWSLAFNVLGLTIGDSSPAEQAFVMTMSVASLVGAPLWALLGLFVQAGIYHVALMVFGGANRDFTVTLRVVSYAMGPNLLSVVPICGGIIGGIWTLVLTILGAHLAHRTDAWRAIVAYFLPMLVCCCILATIIILIVGAIAGAAGASSGFPGF